jgi:hypothetical protein
MQATNNNVLLVKANSGVILSTDRLRLVSVRDIVAHMAERSALGRLTVPRGLQAVTSVPRKADVEPFLPLSRPVAVLLGCLGLATEGLLGPGTEERVPRGFQFPGAEEGLRIPPAVGVLSQTVVDKLAQDGSSLVDPCQVGLAELSLEHKTFDGLKAVVPWMDKTGRRSQRSEGQLQLSQLVDVVGSWVALLVTARFSPPLNCSFLCWCVRACMFCVGYIVLKLLVCDVAYVRMVFFMCTCCCWVELCAFPSSGVCGFRDRLTLTLTLTFSTLSYCSKSHAMHADTGDRPMPGFHGTRPWPVNPLYTSYAD